MTDELSEQIKKKMDEKSTEELLTIWEENNREEWSDDAFMAIKIILLERGETLPDQIEDQPVIINKQSIAKIDNREEPVDTEIDPESGLGKFAAENGIDVTIPDTEQVLNEKQAKKDHETWQRLMPATKSAYKPSGRMPFKALGLMMIGGVLGVPAGMVTGSVVSALGLLTVGLLGAILQWLANMTDRVFCCPAILIIITLIVTFVAIYGLGGAVAATCVTKFGEIGKNRNSLFAIIIALPSAAAAAFFFPQIFNLLSGFLTGDFSGIDIEKCIQTGFSLAGIIVGIVIAVVCAAIVSHEQVISAKFCEDCEEYMDAFALPNLSFHGLRILIKAIKGHNFSHVLDCMESAGGKGGQPLIFSCSGCGKGYLDLKAVFERRWTKTKKNGETQENELKKSWLVASSELDDAQTKALKPYITGEAEK